MKNIFFNSSMPRACSTLLQNILNQNPSIYATGTDGSLELLYAARTNYTSSPEFKANDQELMKTAWRGFCRGGLNGYCESLTEKPNVCIKSRGIGIHWNWYSSFMGYPVKVLCMVRDVRAIFASMERLYRENQERHQPIQNHAEMTGTTTAKRIDIWLNSQPIGLALERFHQMILEGINKNVLFIRAEDLTNVDGANGKVTSNMVMQHIYQYLDLPYYQHNWDWVDQITKEDDEVYGINGLHTIKNKVEPLKPNWKAILGDDICAFLNQRLDWYQRYFGYTR